MRIIDRDLKLLALANLLYATGLGLYMQLLFVYALQLGASRFTIGALNAIMMATIMVINVPGAWAATRFRLKRVLVARVVAPGADVAVLLPAPSWQWLIPGLILFGLTFANNPAFKAYVYLKSEPSSVGASMAFVFASYSLGLVAAPLLGGWLADRYGMRTVFLISTLVYAASATAVCFLRDPPQHPATGAWRPADLLRQPRLPRPRGVLLPGLLGGLRGAALHQPLPGASAPSGVRGPGPLLVASGARGCAHLCR